MTLTSPYKLDDATMTIDALDFTAAIGGVEFVPSASTGAWRGIGGNTIQGTSVATWVCNINFAQDLDPDGLLRFLLDNEGESVQAVFTATAGGPTITATVHITPGTIGGQAETTPILASSVSLPVDGKPAFADVP